MSPAPGQELAAEQQCTGYESPVTPRFVGIAEGNVVVAVQHCTVLRTVTSRMEPCQVTIAACAVS